MCASLFCGATLLGLILRPSTWLAYLNLLALLNLAAMLVPLTLLVAPKVIRGIRGALPVRLACSSLAASGRVFVLSAIAASVAITLIVGLSVMVESFRATLRGWSDVRLSGDLFVSATLGGKGNESRIDPEIVERIESIRGIAQVVPYYETASEVGSKAVVVGGTALALQCKRGVYIFTKGGCLASDGDWRSKAIVSEGAARRLGVSQGSIVSLDSQDYYVFGVIQEFGTEQPLIIIDHSDFQRRYQGHHPQTLTIDLIAGADRDTARAEINSLAPGLLIVRDHAQLSELVETLFNRTFRVTDTVRWIVFSMALLGLLSTLAQQIWERRRELKVVQVLGVSRPILTLALVIELFVSSIAAVAIGVIVGIGLGWCLIRYINPLVFGWSLSFGLSGSVFLEALLFLAILLAIGCLVTVSILSLVSRAIKLADE
jgi:putative ABC transport system permease protein